ncbi:hypothetical protein KFL_001510110 [Klebsormidium nitens]|uniref:Uncharacterized protein n=1 Tax=Klebsormidium nitens TaxID=105231 RepID=A0A1Y1I5X0_KLENI|nr:hypothetical protein KFL_001510110 [Klebsormidium nitens]|eukprot:GAQ83508.1 hypothetical protein KFL_001510110 [Klebsormidium nitens]
MEAVVAHFFVTPKLYDLDKTLLPAVEPLLGYLGSRFDEKTWFVKLYWGCLDALESRCVKPPQLDVWVLPTASACGCGGCKQLVQFCMDPFRVELQLPCPGRDAKEHLIDSVRRNQMPFVISNEEGALENEYEPLFCIKTGAEEDFDQRSVDRHSKLQEEYDRNMSTIEDMRAWIAERCGLVSALIDSLDEEQDSWYTPGYWTD